jgi:hypothetical protein
VLKASKAPIVPCKYVDWDYFEELNDPHYNAAIEICKEFGLYELMGFRYDWNTEILVQFLSSLYYDEYQVTFYWTTEGEKYGIDYMTFSRILGLGSKDEERDPIHVEQPLRGDQVPQLFFNPTLANEGNTSTLQPCYYGLNRFFRSTIDAKKGDDTALRHFVVNLLAHTLPGGRPFCIMDYMRNELRRVMVGPNKHLPSAPYIKYMIEKVTKVTFPKDHKHAPLHLRPR